VGVAVTTPRVTTGRQKHFVEIVPARPSSCAWDEATSRAAAFAARIQPIYDLLDWRWGLNPSLSVPTVARIESCLRHLIARLRETVDASLDTAWLGRWVQTGGLKVTCGLDVLGSVAITLAFSVEEEVDAAAIGGGA